MVEFDPLLGLGRIRSSSTLVGVVVVVIGIKGLGDNSISSSSDLTVTPVEGEDKGVDERDIVKVQVEYLGVV